MVLISQRERLLSKVFATPKSMTRAASDQDKLRTIAGD